MKNYNGTIRKASVFLFRVKNFQKETCIYVTCMHIFIHYARIYMPTYSSIHQERRKSLTLSLKRTMGTSLKLGVRLCFHY